MAYSEADLDRLDRQIRGEQDPKKKQQLINEADRVGKALIAQDIAAEKAAEKAAKAAKDDAAKRDDEEQAHQWELQKLHDQQAHEKDMAQLKLQEQQLKHDLALQRAQAQKQDTADRAAAKKAAARQQAIADYGSRTHIGPAPSKETRVGDTIVTAGVGAGTAVWTATRPSAQGILWALGFMGLGVISMVESQPGTSLESGAAGALGANAAVLVLHLFNLAK